MQEVMKDAGIEMTVNTFLPPVKRLTDTITIPFHGEPLFGFTDCRGVGNTRIGFRPDHHFPVNEGHLSNQKRANSFIPYNNLRKGFWFAYLRTSG